MRFCWNSCSMAQKALGSCDLVGTHVVWLAKSLGIMRFGWNSYMVWLKKHAEKRRRKRNPTSDVYKRQREKQHLCQKTIQNYPVVFFFGVSLRNLFGHSDFGGLFRSFGDMCHFGFSERVVSEFWRYVSLRNFGYSYFRGLFRSFEDKA